MNPFNFNFGDDNDQDNLLKIIPPNYAVVKNDRGQIRVNKVGLSFTCLFFCNLPAIFRADWYNFFCMIGVELFGAMLLTYATGVNLYTAASSLTFFFFTTLDWHLQSHVLSASPESRLQTR